MHTRSGVTCGTPAGGPIRTRGCACACAWLIVKRNCRNLTPPLLQDSGSPETAQVAGADSAAAKRTTRSGTVTRASGSALQSYKAIHLLITRQVRHLIVSHTAVACRRCTATVCAAAPGTSCRRRSRVGCTATRTPACVTSIQRAYSNSMLVTASRAAAAAHVLGGVTVR